MAQTRTSLDTFLSRPHRHVARLQFIDGWTLTLQARHDMMSLLSDFSPAVLRRTRSRQAGCVGIAVLDLKNCRLALKKRLRPRARRLSHYQVLLLNALAFSVTCADQSETMCRLDWRIETLDATCPDGKIGTSLGGPAVDSFSFHVSSKNAKRA